MDGTNHTGDNRLVTYALLVHTAKHSVIVMCVFFKRTLLNHKIHVYNEARKFLIIVTIKCKKCDLFVHVLILTLLLVQVTMKY